MKKTILCIRTADFEDPHVEEVGKHIKALDSEARLVTFVPLQDGHFIEITTGNVFEPDPTCLFVVDGKRIPAKSITSVWYRWLPKSVSAAKDLQGYIAKEFAFKEWEKVIRSLESYLSHARWLNPLAVSELADCKPYQLRLAQEVGLTVPSTTITNNPVAVEKLFDRVENGRVIFKTMEKCFIPPDIMLYTTEITTKFPSMSRTDIAQCPAIFQELVERRSDLRITVVGREVFVARIASQMLEEEKDRLDWRRCQDRDELYTEVQVSIICK